MDVPFNGDPAAVRLMPGAADAVALVRAAGIPVAVVSNQSGIARGILESREVDSVNARVDELLGPLDAWFVCPHGERDGCACRKPEPGLVLQAAAAFGVDPADVVVIGDIGADTDAARAAGARGILVPTPVTRVVEIAEAGDVAGTLLDAVRLALAGRTVAEAVR